MYLYHLSTQSDMWVNPLQDPSASKKKSKSRKVLKKAKKKALKAASHEATPSERPNPVENGVWKGFNLVELGVPLEAYPKSDREHKGKCGYTVSATNGAVPNWNLESFVIEFEKVPCSLNKVFQQVLHLYRLSAGKTFESIWEHVWLHIVWVPQTIFLSAPPNCLVHFYWATYVAGIFYCSRKIVIKLVQNRLPFWYR